MVKRGEGLIYFLFLYPNEGRGLERGLKRRGLNTEITVPPCLPIPSQTCCRRRAN
jgi:hypothetical protein